MGVTGGPSTSIKVAWLRLFFPLDDTHSSGYSGVVRFVPPGQYPFDNALKRGTLNLGRGALWFSFDPWTETCWSCTQFKWAVRKCLLESYSD
ncbi:hypothetical protein Y032_0093g2620 [Ancylostoma ceylanicum]|uniref:Uncharacterized protein n=1 Tax=Ancylostoma ceylanicum TaxID=53326 RepID=A0A016TLC2_9BILA|nr:hypothetical protein Y032_0093g2620 [Ancylostoma ceylanicum]